MNPPLDERSGYTAEELIQVVEAWQESIRAEMISYEENAAIHAPDDGLTTDQRAIAALRRPERFPGEHQVARMWIQTSPTIRLFGRKEELTRRWFMDGYS